MARLLYVPRFDENGAGPRYRVYQFLDSLRQSGIEITVKPLFDLNYLNNLYFKKKRSIFSVLKTYFKRAVYLTINKKKFDLIFMDGELFPFIPYFIEKLFLPKRFIIDQDDAIFHTYDNHRLWIVRKLLRNKIAKVWKRSKHVIVGNNYIKEKAMQMGVTEISVLPTVVNANKYISAQSDKKISADKDKVVIGWVGSPTTIHSMEHIKQALININKKANIALHIIGANFNVEGIETLCIDWKQGWNEDQEIAFTNQIDIGIMPLIETPYEKGKGGFKLIKYMACEKPIIASPVGINTELVDHDSNGYLAATPADWEKYLLTLIENPELRKEFGKAGRNKMVAKYSYQAVQPILCEIVMREIDSNRRLD